MWVEWGRHRLGARAPKGNRPALHFGVYLFGGGLFYCGKIRIT